MKMIIKKGQTTPVYSVFTNRAFERIQLPVQSWETESHCVCHFLIILLKTTQWYVSNYNWHAAKSQNHVGSSSIILAVYAIFTLSLL